MVSEPRLWDFAVNADRLPMKTDKNRESRGKPAESL